LHEAVLALNTTGIKILLENGANIYGYDYTKGELHTPKPLNLAINCLISNMTSNPEKILHSVVTRY
jgi:hypothetical protein